MSPFGQTSGEGTPIRRGSKEKGDVYYIKAVKA